MSPDANASSPTAGSYIAARGAWLRWFLRLTIAGALIAALPVAYAGMAVFAGAYTGWAIGLVMCVASGWLAFSSIGTSLNRFMLGVFGGMLVRMFIVAASTVVVVVTAYGHTIAFVTGLLSTYVLSQVLEIVMIRRAVSANAGASQ